MIDSHCHPQFPQYDTDRAEVIKRALAGDVQLICVGTDLEKSKQAIELAEKYNGMWATVGVHPNDISIKESVLSIKQFEELAKEEKVVAIGEVGLDYYRTPNPADQAKQRQIFKQFIELAGETKLPLIIHSRNAFQDTLDLLVASRQSLGTIPAVVHSFTYTWSECQPFLDLGLSIGLNGIITFTDQYDELIRNVPLDRILLETDAPFLAPVPHRGKRNEPLWVTAVVKQIAKVKNISVEEAAEVTTQNVKKLFGLATI